MSVPTEFHPTLCRTYHTLCISARQPITEVKAEWNVATDVWEIGTCMCFNVETNLPELVLFLDFWVSNIPRYFSFASFGFVNILCVAPTKDGVHKLYQSIAKP